MGSSFRTTTNALPRPSNAHGLKAKVPNDLHQSVPGSFFFFFFFWFLTPCYCPQIRPLSHPLPYTQSSVVSFRVCLQELPESIQGGEGGGGGKGRLRGNERSRQRRPVMPRATHCSSQDVGRLLRPCTFERPGRGCCASSSGGPCVASCSPGLLGQASACALLGFLVQKKGVPRTSGAAAGIGGLGSSWLGVRHLHGRRRPARYRRGDGPLHVLHA